MLFRTAFYRYARGNCHEKASLRFQHILTTYQYQSILNLQAPLDRMIHVYPIDYRTEQNFKGTEIEKQKLDNLLLLVAKAIGIKLFLNREIPEVLVLPWETLESEFNC